MTLESSREKSLIWPATVLGQSFQQATAAELFRIFPQTYFSVVLDLGPGAVKYFEYIDTGIHFRVNPIKQEDVALTVIGKWEGLPLGRNSVDLCVLQHTLDFAIDPRRVLREAIEVLSPPGWIVICGFNPMGLWGIARILFQSSKKMPWLGRFVRPAKLQDWMTLLGLQVMSARFFFYRPPVDSMTALKKLNAMERAGSRWWPTFSGAYLIAGQKGHILSHSVQKKYPITRGRIARPLHTTMKTDPVTTSV